MQKALRKWNIKANYLDEYYKILKHDKLYIIEVIFRYEKRYREKAFLLTLQHLQKASLSNEKQMLQQKQENQLKASDKLFKIYNKNNGVEKYDQILIKHITKKNAKKT